MDQLLKQSTAATVKLGPFVDDTDGKTAETGLTISQADIRLSKNGGSFAQTNNATGATHDENGYYGVPLDTTDTATLGRLRVAVSESGALPVWQDFMVVPANVYDAMVGGSDYLQVDAVQIEGSDATDTLDSTVSGLSTFDASTDAVDLNADQSGVTIGTVNAATLADGAHGGGSTTLTLQTPVEANAVQISGDSTAADNAEAMFDGTGYAGGTIKLGVDAVAISGDSTAADNLESDYDGTGYNKSASTIGTANTIGSTGIAAINATVDTALSDIKLDKLVSANSTLSSDLTAGCIFDQVMSIDGIGDYDRTTDSLEAIGYQANLITANTAIESATITAGDTFELVQGSDKDITVSVAVSAIDLSSGSPTVKIGLTKINSNSETSAPGTIDGTINNAGVQGSQSVTFSFPKATTGDMALSDYSNRIKSGSPRVDNAYQYTIVAHDYPSASKCTPIPNGQGYVKVLEADGAGCA